MPGDALQLGTAALHREGMSRPGKHFRIVLSVADHRDFLRFQLICGLQIVDKDTFMRRSVSNFQKLFSRSE